MICAFEKKKKDTSQNYIHFPSSLMCRKETKLLIITQCKGTKNLTAQRRKNMKYVLGFIKKRVRE